MNGLRAFVAGWVIGLLSLAVSSYPEKGLASQEIGVEWDLLAFPELIVNGYLQEDVAVGRFSRHNPIGFDGRPASQQEDDLRPVNLGEGGISFSGDGQFLEFSGVRDALAAYRWVLIIFRIDSDSSEKETDIISVNAIGKYGNIPGSQMPRISYRSESNALVALWRGKGPDGSRYYGVENSSVVADGETWNVVLAYRRHGRLFLNVNGNEAKTNLTTTLSFSAPSAQNDAISRIGDPKMGASPWAYDAIVFGQTELSEALVEKIEAWALWRMGHQSLLPARHPYRTEAPRVDDEDFPHRYSYDAERWKMHWDRNPDASRRAFHGELLPEVIGYERVFFDDFRTNRVSDSTAGEGGEASIWYAPGHNHSVGRLARLIEPSRAPELYRHDGEEKTLTLSLQYDEGWKGAAIYSVNDAGVGRSWQGGGIFRVRVKFPEITSNPGVGYFPAAPWFYNLEQLFWRTSERIEFDGFEFEGIDDRWINGGSSHVHSGRFPGLFGKLAEDAPAMEIFNDQAWVDVWDGEFHTWEVRIYDDVTILGVDGLEIARVETPVEYLERLYMILNVAAKRNKPEPDPEAIHEMTIDYVEVLQATDKLASVQLPFMQRPKVRGIAKVGATLTCDAWLEPGMDDVWYFWYADGYPLGFDLSPKLRVLEEHAGSRLRCMVRAAGARDAPEAWAPPTERVAKSP
ncbi:LamG domain-containing protein [Ovoidimarina sediminis]|uniref:hypothetical protein n=1 Tax=Ovoidimarina sediminis TaxID=3079856 RepID=UPI00290AC856|nr:hypothetical protein [Rhodophyticola sp. MJ-SS7]MDU8945534.1 hypothetical protein [Rhodophyticola sp. MJ-SS7]